LFRPRNMVVHCWQLVHPSPGCSFAFGQNIGPVRVGVFEHPGWRLGGVCRQKKRGVYILRVALRRC
jgi:hypothetical protein